ncbi:MAG: hypothetical protein A2V64_04805 [Bacteroidetes bacterium RBG_13_43_22]|nr:MAG: hypothetical protein A2V64_04805 [Bacteroidetes bacterium RBG_13_43_22]
MKFIAGSSRIFICCILSIILFSFILLGSCYHKEPLYSFNISSGGVMIGSSCYYLAQVREYRNPKGISRFPDGGQTKEIRQLFGLFRTDTIHNTTVLATRFGDVHGWPVRYKTRLDKNDSLISIGIVNINLADSVNGIYLYNFDSGKTLKYSAAKALPSLSKTGTQIAYCNNKTVLVEDYSSNTSTARYLLETEPVFIDWEIENGILLFCSDPFRVMKLDLRTGTVSSSDMKYIANYSQELGVTEIRSIVSKSIPDLEKLLDNN